MTGRRAHVRDPFAEAAARAKRSAVREAKTRARDSFMSSQEHRETSPARLPGPPVAKSSRHITPAMAHNSSESLSDEEQRKDFALRTPRVLSPPTPTFLADRSAQRCCQPRPQLTRQPSGRDLLTKANLERKLSGARAVLAERGLQLHGSVAEHDAATAATTGTTGTTGTAATATTVATTTTETTAGAKICGGCGEPFSLVWRWKYRCPGCDSFFCRDCFTEGSPGAREMCFECAYRDRIALRSVHEDIGGMERLHRAEESLRASMEAHEGTARRQGNGETMEVETAENRNVLLTKTSASEGAVAAAAAVAQWASPRNRAAVHSPSPRRSAPSQSSLSPVPSQVSAAIAAAPSLPPPPPQPPMGPRRQLSAEAQALVHEAASVGGGNSLSGRALARQISEISASCEGSPRNGYIEQQRQQHKQWQQQQGGEHMSSAEAAQIYRSSRNMLAAGIITPSDHADVEQRLQRAGLRRHLNRQGSHYEMILVH